MPISQANQNICGEKLLSSKLYTRHHLAVNSGILIMSDIYDYYEWVACRQPDTPYCSSGLIDMPQLMTLPPP